MKGTFHTVFSLMLGMTLLTGCASETAVTDEPETDQDDIQEETQTETEETEELKSLLIYFSRTGEQYSVGEIEKGNTAIVADMIREYTGADVFEILPEEDYYPYTYDALTEIAKEEQNTQARPAYQNELPDLSQYDVIFIGSPVWWADWPMIMYTMFESNDFSGKTLIPFDTNEGSGNAGFEDKLKSKCPDSVVKEGLYTYGHDAQNNPDQLRKNVREWLIRLGIING